MTRNYWSEDRKHAALRGLGWGGSKIPKQHGTGRGLEKKGGRRQQQLVGRELMIVPTRSCKATGAGKRKKGKGRGKKKTSNQSACVTIRSLEATLAQNLGGDCRKERADEPSEKEPGNR